MDRKSTYRHYNKPKGKCIAFSRMLLVMVSLFCLTITVQSQNIAFVGGSLTEDKTWSNDTTYIVWSDLIIPNGRTLIIPPGTKVRVNFGWGIFVRGGNLLVGDKTGSQTDTVSFVSNWVTPGEFWRWKGISFSNVYDENQNFIAYARIQNTEVAAVRISESSHIDINHSSLSDTNSTGLMVDHSTHISLRNCLLQGNETAAISVVESDDIFIDQCVVSGNEKLGIDIRNTSDCSIENCSIEANEDGIRFEVNNLAVANDNKVLHCVLKNENHNIYIINSQSYFFDNTIAYNIVEGGRNGIWMQNDDGIESGHNSINHNIIYGTGENVGYGLFNMLDSTKIFHNIFWANSEAIVFGQYGHSCELHHNSFYQNGWTVAFSQASVYNSLEHNTLAYNLVRTMDFKSVEGHHFDKNNMFFLADQEQMLVNHHGSDVDLTGNFWGSTSSNRIDELIWDAHDESGLGTIHFDPILLAADTNSPVSPPLGVIKQEVNGQLRLSWRSNVEEDIVGYRIYEGNFNNYSFENQIDNGSDTLAWMPEIPFGENIAITAYDGSLTGVDDQLEGFESPFAFAQPFPYAGPDTIVCTNQEALNISFGTAPFIYKSLLWTTSGDGSFENEDEIQTKYYPGTEDLEEKSVVIYLEVVRSEFILKDSFLLTILDGPQVYAGKDTTVFNDAHIELSDASAAFYDQVNWFSDGDGSFNSDTVVNPTYIPGSSDIENGSVILVMEATSECGLTSDSVHIILEDFHSLQGKVWHAGEEVEPAVVLALKLGEPNAKAEAMTKTLSDGSFIFERLRTGAYYVYAVPDTHNVYEAIPSYYADKSDWEQAHEIAVIEDVFDVDIELLPPDVSLPEGEAVISGQFVMPPAQLVNTDLYCAPWFNTDNEAYCNGGLSNISVFLMSTDLQRIMAYTLTDKKGNFYFKSLAYGNYQVVAEKASYAASISPEINLSPDHPIESGVVMEMEDGKITVAIVVPEMDPPMVYPNPTSASLTIKFPTASVEPVLLEIFNCYGQLILQDELRSDGSKMTQGLQLNVSTFSSGLYLGRLHSQTSPEQYHFSFVKQ